MPFNIYVILCVLLFTEVCPYQEEIIEEKDLSLKLGQFLFVRFIGIRHLKQTTAAHQTSVRHSKDLQKLG